MIHVSDHDPFDPRYWEHVDYDYRIYLDDDAVHFAHVSEDDYHFLLQYKWHAKIDHRTNKVYARRLSNVYLHRVVMVRACFFDAVCPPSPEHFLIDHIDGDALNCRRENLRWATWWDNNNNIHGRYHQQRRFEFT